MELEDISDFKKAIDRFGFNKFWDMFIDAYLAKERPDLRISSDDLIIDDNKLFSFDNIGDLYEIALEYNNQISKKALGQYYTPKDVCSFMSKKLLAEYKEDYHLADVCSGTGNLIIEVLKQLGGPAARRIISSSKLHLYDLDPIATKLAIMKIGILFAEDGKPNSYKDIAKSININVGNYLSDKIRLPKDCFVISNPPYGKLPRELPLWRKCTTKNTKDLYAVFMEKIAQQSTRSVVISPQSFIGGGKFSSLRSALVKYGGGGEIYCFDNVPSPLFCGRKKGIFNTNTSNSVRAAITLMESDESGYQTTPLIRFKAEERKQLFEGIEKLLGLNRYKESDAWTKIPKTLEPLVKTMQKEDKTVLDLIEKDQSKQKEELMLTIPSTPRYYVSATKRSLDRSSKIILYAKDEAAFEKLYLLINSSFSYLWWRIYDGGITLGKNTLLSLPVPDVTNNVELHSLINDCINLEDEYLVNKKNAGKNNENVKFPPEYRKRFNSVILNKLKAEDAEDSLINMHSNSFIEYSKHWA